MADQARGTPRGEVVSVAELVKARRRFRVGGVLTAVLVAIAVAGAVRGDESSGWLIAALVLAVVSAYPLVTSWSLRRMVRSNFRVQRWMLPRDASSADRRCARCGRPLQAIPQVTGRGGALPVWDDPGAQCGRCGGPLSPSDRIRQLEAAQQMLLAEIDERAGRPVGGRIRVMWDYDAWPLWPFERSESADPSHVGLPADLTDDLQAWSDELTAVMWGTDGPDANGFTPDPAAVARLDHCGLELAGRVKRALGPTWHVTYVGEIDGTEVEIADT